MFKPLGDFRNFLYTQYFSDGVKITIGVLLPSLIFFQYGKIEIGLTMSIGAVCASIPDSPGPWFHRRNSMLITIALVGLTVLVTTMINQNQVLTAMWIFFFFFCGAMLNVYGNRAAAVGTATLLMLVLNIDKQLSSIAFANYVFYTIGGGLWYFLLSALFSTLRPYRYAQQTLGDCIQEIARYMRIRAKFYNESIPVEDIFKELVDKQVIVHGLQDNVREVLFKTRKLINESTPAGRLMVVIFTDVIDLFEQTMATHHDYDVIRKRYKNHDILPSFALLIHQLSQEIEYIGFCMVHQIKPSKHVVRLEDLETLKVKLDELENQGTSTLVLKKIIINLRHIFFRVQNLYNYFDNPDFNKKPKSETADRTRFVSHQSFDLKLVRNNLNLKSGTFRYALRLAIVALFGYIIGNFLPVGHHGYWIVLTILVILKPGFSSTKQRYYERVIGTLLGGIFGALLLYFVHDETARFILMVLFMIIAYSSQRIQYFIFVLFLTPFILIMFSFITSVTNQSVALERVIDTLIGSGIAFLSSYLIFPSWESYQFKNYLQEMLKANLRYFETIYQKLSDNPVDITEYKLARKEVYVKTANLAAAFQRMLNEPKNKQHKAVDTHKFVVLNHVLSSYLANFSASIQENDFVLDKNHHKLYKKASFYLKEAIQAIASPSDEAGQNTHLKGSAFEGESSSGEDLLTEQLELIAKVSSDILKITEKIV